MVYTLRDAILWGLLSGFEYPVNGDCSTEKKESPVKIVAYCKCRDVTGEEEKENV